MSNLEAFLVLTVVYGIGKFVGTKTKAWIPPVFVTATLFVIGYCVFCKHLYFTINRQMIFNGYQSFGRKIQGLYF